MDIRDLLLANANQVMLDRGITKADIVRRADMSKAYVYMMFNKDYEPSLEYCDRLAAALGMSLVDLLTYTKDTAPGVSELIDLYNRSDIDGRRTILDVARAQAAFHSS